MILTWGPPLCGGIIWSAPANRLTPSPRRFSLSPSPFSRRPAHAPRIRPRRPAVHAAVERRAVPAHRHRRRPAPRRPGAAVLVLAGHTRARTAVVGGARGLRLPARPHRRDPRRGAGT